MSALDAVMMTLKKEAEAKLIPGVCSHGAASAEWNGRKLSARAEFAHGKVRSGTARRVFWYVEGKRVATAKVSAALGEQQA